MPLSEGRPEPDCGPRGAARVAAVHEALVSAGTLTPLALGGFDETLWTDCELASFAEHRLGDGTDPRWLDGARRARWLADATLDPVQPPGERASEQGYWLTHEGRRVGTVALGTALSVPKRLDIWSLYVFPSERGAGHAFRALQSIRGALAAEGLGLRLSTSWTWQHTLRFYLRFGLWVRMWRRDVDLYVDPDMPSPRTTFRENTASLCVALGDRTVELASATREGERLFVESRAHPLEASTEPLLWDAASTLAVTLALAGWPLVRSAADCGQWGASDGVHPEGLARRIVRWEGWYRARGWRVETPRIPGLDYARWED